MGEIISNEEARYELGRLNISQLRMLAMERMLPAEGFNEGELIEALMGNCPKCKGKMNVEYLDRNGNQSNQPAPCVGCGK